MSAEEFVRRLRMSADQHDVHYAFWIGAGCSVSAGIPGAASLVADRWLPRLQKVRAISEAEFDSWVEKEFSGYDPSNPAAMYGKVMEDLFIQPEARQREVEELCDGRFPGFAYAVLAALLAREDGLFNVALTTNFDDLIADAMYVFTEARPLVIPDEALAAYIRPTRMRPLVIKVHGDHRLSPRNTQAETATLKQGISESISNLLHDRGVIFIGYGGHDKGIADLLAALPSQALPLGVWWASRSEPLGVLAEWLKQREAIWIETPGFDELMLLFKSEFEVPDPSSTKFDQLFASYLSTYSDLEKQVERIPDSDPQASSLKGAAARTAGSTTSWSAIYMRASRMEESEPEKAEEQYISGVEEFPQVGLLLVALVDLQVKRSRYDEAIKWAKKAIELEPSSRSAQRAYTYALALSGHMDDALQLLQDAVNADYRDFDARALLGSYSALVGNKEEAERQFEALSELRPSNSTQWASLASLADGLGKHDLASGLHTRAISENPNDPMFHANYGRCLIAMDKPSDALKQAEISLKHVSKADLRTRLEAELYRLVVGGPKYRSPALTAIKQLILKGVTIPTWDLSLLAPYVQGKEDPDADWIEKLVEVIGGSRAAEVLDDWPLWQTV